MKYVKSTHKVLARTGSATKIPSRVRNRKLAVSLSNPWRFHSAFPSVLARLACGSGSASLVTVVELDGDRLQEAPLVSAIALHVGEERSKWIKFALFEKCEIDVKFSMAIHFTVNSQ